METLPVCLSTKPERLPTHQEFHLPNLQALVRTEHEREATVRGKRQCPTSALGRAAAQTARDQIPLSEAVSCGGGQDFTVGRHGHGAACLSAQGQAMSQGPATAIPDLQMV